MGLSRRCSYVNSRFMDCFHCSFSMGFSYKGEKFIVHFSMGLFTRERGSGVPRSSYVNSVMNFLFGDFEKQIR